MDLDEYQKMAAETNETKDKAAPIIFGLVGEVGSIYSTLKKRFLNPYPAFKDELAVDYLTNPILR